MRAVFPCLKGGPMQIVRPTVAELLAAVQAEARRRWPAETFTVTHLPTTGRISIWVNDGTNHHVTGELLP